MATIASLLVNLFANTAEFDAKMEKSARKSQQATKKIEASWLNLAKKQLGGESQFGGFFKILTGAGAVAGLGLATRVLDNIATKAEEMSTAFARGEINAAGVAEGLLKSVPILGNLITAGEKFSRILDGSIAKQAELDQRQAARDAAGDAARNIANTRSSGVASLLDMRNAIARQNALDAASPMVREGMIAAEKNAEERRKIMNQAAQSVASVTAEAAAAVAALRENIDTARKNLGSDNTAYNLLTKGADFVASMDRRRLEVIERSERLIALRELEATEAIKQIRIAEQAALAEEAKRQLADAGNRLQEIGSTVGSAYRGVFDAIVNGIVPEARRTIARTVATVSVDDGRHNLKLDDMANGGDSVASLAASVDSRFLTGVREAGLSRLQNEMARKQDEANEQLRRIAGDVGRLANAVKDVSVLN